MRGFLCVCSLLGIAAVTGTARAETDVSKYENQDVVVTDKEAKFQVPDGASRPTKVGYRYRTSHSQDSWVWVMRMGGWIDVDALVLESEADRHFSASLKADPSAINFYDRAVMWSVRQEYLRALSDYESAIALNPEMAIAHIGLGSCHWSLGHLDEAMEALERAIELDPTNPAVFNNRGNLWRSLGRMEEALADYSRAAELEPTKSLIYNNRGSCFLSQRKFTEAISDFDEALRLDPFYSDAFNNRGFAWQQLGDYQQAVENFTSASQYDNRLHQAYNNAAWLRATCPDATYRNGDLAVRAAETACELTGHGVWYCVATLAAALAEKGDFPSAIATQRRAMGLMPLDASKAELQEQARRLEHYLDERPYRTGELAPVAFLSGAQGR